MDIFGQYSKQRVEQTMRISKLAAVAIATISLLAGEATGVMARPGGGHGGGGYHGGGGGYYGGSGYRGGGYGRGYRGFGLYNGYGYGFANYGYSDDVVCYYSRRYGRRICRYT